MQEVNFGTFIRWCIAKIDAAKLSDLMQQYGYSRVDEDTIIEAIDASSAFEDDFGLLLRKSLDEPKDMYALSRAQGEITKNDWLAIIAGTVGTFGTAVSGILTGNKATAEQTAAANAAAVANQEKTSDSNVFVWVIGVVILVAVTAIIWLSLSSRKK